MFNFHSPFGRWRVPILGLVSLLVSSLWPVLGLTQDREGEDELRNRYRSERILDYHSDIAIQPDASMEVVETIRVVALGDEIKHGIYRDFPTRYLTPWKFRKSAGFRVVEVLKDGRPEPYHTEGKDNGIRVYVGRKESTVVPGVSTYVIHYKTDRQLGFFPDHDELYWNVTGNGWTFEIDQASATVRLPSQLSRDQIHVEGYTGAEGSKDRNLKASVEMGGTAYFETTQALDRWQGLTIVATWPKGIVKAPSRLEEWKGFLQDNRMTILGAFGLLAILAYYLVVWFKVGRDPEKGTIIPLYEAPDRLSPAAVRYLWKLGYDDKALAAAIIHLAVLKRLKIVDQDGAYSLKKQSNAGGALAFEEDRLFQNLLGSHETLSLKKENRTTIVSAVLALKQDLKKGFEKTYFLTNRTYFIAGIAITLFMLFSSVGAGGAEAVATAGFMAIWLSVWSVGVFLLGRQVVTAWKGVATERGVLGKSFSLFGALFMTAFALPFFAGELVGLFIFGKGTSVWMLGVLLASVFLNILFFHLLKAPTKLGRSSLDKIEGLRMYLGVAEKDRLNALVPPKKTPELFEKFLPYALALDVEQQWAEQFSDVLTEAGKPVTEGYSPGWYTGASVLSAAAFASSIGGSLSGAISSASVSPSSGSGSGGGGSSGGGGGGGGGGGW